MKDGWLIIPNWPKWQSRNDRRDPWIKSYIDQLDRDAYLNLTLAERGLLEGCRYVYARFDGVIRTRNLQGLLGQRVFEKHLDALCDAGYINIVAAKPPPIGGETAARAREEREGEEEEEKETGRQAEASYATDGLPAFLKAIEGGIHTP